VTKGTLRRGLARRHLFTSACAVTVTAVAAGPDTTSHLASACAVIATPVAFRAQESVPSAAQPAPSLSQLWLCS
jgi:hypothetical protein